MLAFYSKTVLKHESQCIPGNTLIGEAHITMEKIDLLVITADCVAWVHPLS